MNIMHEEPVHFDPNSHGYSKVQLDINHIDYTHKKDYLVLQYRFCCSTWKARNAYLYEICFFLGPVYKTICAKV